MAAASGFTLLELLVVLAVIGLVVALSVPMFSSGVPRSELMSATHRIAAELRQARGRAVAGNTEVTFMLDVDGRSFAIDDGPGQQLPGTLELSLQTAQSELIDAARGGIRFFPDGTSTGGSIAVRRTRTTAPTYVIRIDWLTGRVMVAEQDAALDGPGAFDRGGSP